MKKSVLMAVSASVLLTGCLVKKSDYEAEQAAHEATRQELLKINTELATAGSKLKSEHRGLTNARDEISSLRSELSKSRTALVGARQEVDQLKETSASATKRAMELAAKLSMTEQKVAEAKALFTQRFNELKGSADAELSAAQEKNDQLRQFMFENYNSAEFLSEDVPDVIVKKAPEVNVASPVDVPVASVEVDELDVPVAEVLEDEPVAPVQKKWWHFFGKKDQKVASVDVEPTTSAFELGVYQNALNIMDEKAAAKEAMRLMSEQSDDSLSVALGEQLVQAALATEDERIVKWVSTGVIKGAGPQAAVVKSVVLDLVSGTPFNDSVTSLLN